MCIIYVLVYETNIFDVDVRDTTTHKYLAWEQRKNVSMRPLLMSDVKNTITNFNTQGLETNVCSSKRMKLIACEWKKDVYMKPILMSGVGGTIHFNI